MNGARAISEEDQKKVFEAFSGPGYLRDRALFMLGLKTGFRISELLSITVADVLTTEGKMRVRVSVARKHMKGKGESRSVSLHPDAAAAIEAWIESVEGAKHRDRPLFWDLRQPATAISRQWAWKILHDAFDAAEVEWAQGTHAMRKTFASKMFEASGRDIFMTQKLIGHKSPTSTVSYLAVSQQAMDDLVMERKKKT